MKKKIKKIAKDIMKKSVFLRKIIRKVHFLRYSFKYNRITKKIPVDDKTIIFACFNAILRKHYIIIFYQMKNLKTINLFGHLKI